MKKNRIITAGTLCFKKACILQKQHPMECLIVFLIFLFRTVWYKNVQIAQLPPDSYSYINYGYQIPSNGRTPVYPYIINTVRFLGENYLIAVVILQIVVSMISVVFLYKLLFLITENKYLALAVTAVYGVSPTVIQWDTMILTESLGISGSVFFLYLIVNYIYKPSIFYGAGATAAAFILTMHRPSLMLINYALFFFWIFRLYYRGERHILKRIIPLSIIVIALLMLYSYLVYQTYGDFSLTPLTPRHLLAACLRSGVYQNTPDVELAQMIQDIFEKNNRSLGYATTTPIMELFGTDPREINLAVKEFCLDCIQRNPAQYISSISETMNLNANAPLYTLNVSMAYEHSLFKPLISLQTSLCTFFKFGHLYFLCAMEAAATLWIYIHQKRLAWVHLGLAVFLTMMVLYTFVGTYAAFGRCMIHTLPFAVLSLTCMLDSAIKILHKGEF